MRILRVAHRLFPDDPGGGAYHVHAMSRDQAAMGHDVTVLTVGDRHRRERRDGYAVVTVPTLVAPLGNEIAPGVWRHLRRDGYDVVHAHSHLYVSTNLAALTRRLGGPPLAITNHGLYSQSAPERVFDVYLRTLGRWTFDAADLVFCYTSTDRERLRDLGVRAPIAVVANGIDAERFSPRGPVSDRIPADGPVVLFVGRLVEGKRPVAALEAVARLREGRPSATLTVVGDGPLRADLESLARDLGVESSVRFLGSVTYDEMPAIYRGADVLALPSRTEGVPRTVLEAIAAGVPVVCSELPQLRGLVERDGRGELVDVETDGELARALERWIETDASPPPLADTWSWRTTVAETTEHLRSLAHCR